jgi:hypothetical protein
MNMDTNFSYYKKNNNLLYDIPVFISQPEILIDTSIYNNNNTDNSIYNNNNNNNTIYNKDNMIKISDQFIRDLSMYGYKTNNNEFFNNYNSNNNFKIIISILSFILFIYILFSFFC